MSGAPDAAFYCVADSRYFLGAVGLVNSLRLQGHEEPIHVLDCGLEPWQRELLDGQAALVPAPEDAPPHLLKTIAPLRHPAEVMVLIDADMIVTRHLGELIERAGEGKLVAFEDNMDRWVPEWGELLGLGELEPRPYLCSAFVAAGRRVGEPLLRALERHLGEVEFERTFWGENEAGYPFLYADQDVLNALVAGLLPPDRVALLDARGVPGTPFDGLRIEDPDLLRCAYEDGSEPYLLHHILPAKPWLARLPHGIYPRLLARALVGPGVALRVPDGEIPLRLREGNLARLERARIGARDRLAWLARDHLPGLTRRLDRLRDGVAAR